MFNVLEGSPEHFFNRLLQQGSEREKAILKHQFVKLLLKQQAEADYVFTRALRAQALEQVQVNEWLDAIQRHRQVWQDEFLVVDDVDAIKKAGHSVITRFSEFVKPKVHEAIQREHKLLAEVRIANITASFDEQRFAVFRAGKLDTFSDASLKRQAHIFLESLHRSINTQDLRPEIQDKLIQRLIDDYYRALQDTLEKILKNSRRL